MCLSVFVGQCHVFLALAGLCKFRAGAEDVWERDFPTNKEVRGVGHLVSVEACVLVCNPGNGT